MGKSKCCCNPQKILHMKFMNLTADFGFPIPDNEELTLWEDVQAQVYCIFGPLKDCFNLETGEFTVKETGLYAITVLPTFQPGADGDRLVRVIRTYGSPRCNGTSLIEISALGQTQVNLTASPDDTLMTFSAVQPLAVGDKLKFITKQTSGGTLTLFFEFNITKLSAANKELFDPTMTLPPT